MAYEPRRSLGATCRYFNIRRAVVFSVRCASSLAVGLAPLTRRLSACAGVVQAQHHGGSPGARARGRDWLLRSAHRPREVAVRVAVPVEEVVRVVAVRVAAQEEEVVVQRVAEVRAPCRAGGRGCPGRGSPLPPPCAGGCPTWSGRLSAEAPGSREPAQLAASAGVASSAWSSSACSPRVDETLRASVTFGGVEQSGRHGSLCPRHNAFLEQPAQR